MIYLMAVGHQVNARTVGQVDTDVLGRTLEHLPDRAVHVIRADFQHLRIRDERCVVVYNRLQECKLLGMAHEVDLKSSACSARVASSLTRSHHATWGR